MRVAFALVAVTAAAALAVPAATADVAPATMTGETLVAFETPVLVGSSEVTGTCNPTTVSTFDFRVTGVASGPYSGIFDEEGTFSVGPAPTFGLLSFQSSFSIHGADATVTGTKSLATGGAIFGVCNSFAVAGGLQTDNVQLTANVDYSAQITTAAGTSDDSGTSLVDYGDTRLRGVPGLQGFSFTETYASSSFFTTPGRATGGGQLAGGINFGFVAMGPPSGPKGMCTVNDPVADVHVKCVDVLTYTQTGNNAIFTGDATVNGVPTTYRIDVADNSEPNNGSDLFAIQTATGYTAGGPVISGNIQVR